MPDFREQAELIIEAEAKEQFPGSAFICAPGGLPLMVLPNGTLIPVHRRLAEIERVLAARWRKEQHENE